MPWTQSIELSRLNASSQDETTLSFKFDDQHGDVTVEQTEDGGCRLIFTPRVDWTGTVEVVISRTTAEGTQTEVAPLVIVEPTGAQKTVPIAAPTQGTTETANAFEAATVNATANATGPVLAQSSEKPETLAHTGISSPETGALGFSLVIGGAVTVVLSRRLGAISTRN